MRLAELDNKADEMGMKFLQALESKGIEGFFAENDALKKTLEITDADIKELEYESYNYCQYKEWPQAANALVYLVLFEPQQTQYYLRLGSVLMELGAFEGAIIILDIAASLQSTDPRPHLYIGSCFLELGNNEKAMEAFDTCIDLATHSAYVNQEYEEIKALALEAKKVI